MANLLHASNGLNLTWRRGTAKAYNGDTVDCLHLTLSDSNGTIQAKAILNANQIARFCLENNKEKS